MILFIFRIMNGGSSDVFFEHLTDDTGSQERYWHGIATNR